MVRREQFVSRGEASQMLEDATHKLSEKLWELFEHVNGFTCTCMEQPLKFWHTTSRWSLFNLRKQPHVKKSVGRCLGSSPIVSQGKAYPRKRKHCWHLISSHLWCYKAGWEGCVLKRKSTWDSSQKIQPSQALSTQEVERASVVHEQLWNVRE